MTHASGTTNALSRQIITSHPLVATISAKFYPATTVPCKRLLNSVDGHILNKKHGMHHSVPVTWTNFFSSTAGWM